MTNKALTADDYEKLKTFMGLYVDWFFPKVGKPENHPLVFIADLEKTSLSNAKRGVQMAVNDILESNSYWTSDQVAAADARFTAQGSITLSEVRRKYSKKHQQVLKRGVIRNETEYYLLKGMMDNGGSGEAAENEQMVSLLAAFEDKVRQQALKK